MLRRNKEFCSDSILLEFTGNGGTIARKVSSEVLIEYIGWQFTVARVAEDCYVLIVLFFIS